MIPIGYSWVYDAQGGAFQPRDRKLLRMTTISGSVHGRDGEARRTPSITVHTIPTAILFSSNHPINSAMERFVMISLLPKYWWLRLWSLEIELSSQRDDRLQLSRRRKGLIILILVFVSLVQAFDATCICVTLPVSRSLPVGRSLRQNLINLS